MKINKNFAFLVQSYNEQSYIKDKLVGGYRGVVLEGGSRSGKTISVVDFIIKLCVQSVKPLVINIIKETYNEFKTTLYNDFASRLTDFGLPNPFENAKEVSSFRICGSKITFLGADKPSKFHGAQCDILYINEALPVSQAIFDQAEMRCEQFWIIDYNPSFTDHWIFDKVVPRDDVGFLHSTFRDNHFVKTQEKIKILGYEPTKYNIEQGTSDKFMWEVYGLGKRGEMEGTIFNNVTYIDEMPELAVTYGLDFGFVADPSVLVRFAQEGNNLYVEPLLYESTETPDILVSVFEALNMPLSSIITCDSSDTRVSENKGSIEMVRSLRIAGYSARKVKKTMGVMYWILKMKRYKIHIVKNNLYKFVDKEVKNYIFKEVNGIMINQPNDAYNHFWDSLRYAFMAYNK